MWDWLDSRLVNGSLKGFFVISRDLQQGNPLSPFIFTTAGKAPSRMIGNAKTVYLFPGFCCGRCRSLSTTVSLQMILQGYSVVISVQENHLNHVMKQQILDY